jgi:cysteinyl-tRNA synthetase, unknown class
MAILPEVSPLRSPPVWNDIVRIQQVTVPEQSVIRHRLPHKSPPIAPRISPGFREMPATGPLATTLRPLMSSEFRSWIYQLTSIEWSAIRDCRADVAVIDYSADGRLANAFTPEQVAAMRLKPGGGETKIIAYMSIGEAESYRDLYWKKEWLHAGNRPRWLGPANDEGWANNYRVRYWDADWQRLIFGSPNSYLDRLIATGFDGVYLDIVDGYEFWQDADRAPGGARATAADDMIDFVGRMARYAWSKSPTFYIVPQNGYGLLESEQFRAHISAIGMEDIFFTWANPNSNRAGDEVKPQPANETAEKLESLQRAQLDHIPVLAVEYLMDRPRDRPFITETETKMRAHGLVPYFAQRQLEQLHCPQQIATQPSPTVPLSKPATPPPTVSAPEPVPASQAGLPPPQPESQSLSEPSTAGPQTTSVPPPAQSAGGQLLSAQQPAQQPKSSSEKQPMPAAPASDKQSWWRRALGTVAGWWQTIWK